MNKKREGTIVIKKLSGKYPFAVDFWGFQQGSGSPCVDMKEVNEEVEYLISKHQKDYDLKINNELEQQQTL